VSSVSLPAHPAEPAVGGLAVTWRILVVESKPEDASDLVTRLRRRGHEVDCVSRGEAALRCYPWADLVLLDFELPDLDGLEICRTIRAASDVPIIAVAQRDSELDCVLGLQAGADDYLVKPFGFRELLARIDAVMRRSRPVTCGTSTQTIAHGGLTIDVGAREVCLCGRRVDLTRKEFDLLLMLAMHPGQVVSRSELQQQVWGDSWSRRTLDTHISSLRAKLGASEWIVTVRGVGFRLQPN
jgi:DNA-binding response OmpR family regulator